MAVEKIKATVRLALHICGLSSSNQLYGEIDATILFAGRFGRIGQIGQQRIKDIGIAIDQIADFEIIHKLANLLVVDQQRGNGHHGGASRVHRFRKIELRQRMRGQNGGDKIIHQLDGGLCGGKQQEQRADDKRQSCRSLAQQAHDQRHHGDQSDAPRCR